MPSRGFTRELRRATLPQIGHEVVHRGGLVPHALTDREAPTAPGEPLPEAISEGELRHIAPHRPSARSAATYPPRHPDGRPRSRTTRHHTRGTARPRLP